MSKSHKITKLSSKKSLIDEITQNYVFEQDIGQGTFGKVKLATHILTNEKVIFKVNLIGCNKNLRERKNIGRR